MGIEKSPLKSLGFLFQEVRKPEYFHPAAYLRSKYLIFVTVWFNTNHPMMMDKQSTEYFIFTVLKQNRLVTEIW